MIPNSCDVVVIGGGPGGSTAATHLARKGYDVVLIDKQVHPRYNVGESAIPLIWRFLDEIDASEKIDAEGFLHKVGGTVRWKGWVNTHTFKAFGYDRPALHIERDRFDKILLDNARENGVKIFEGIPVTGADFSNPEAPVVSCRLPDHSIRKTRCRIVVDASGQGALLGRQFGMWRVDPAFRFMSVWGYFRHSKYIAYGGIAHPPEDIREHPPTTFVSSLTDFGDIGWGWHIPMREETSVGFVLPVDEIKSHKSRDESWEDYFLRMCRETYGFRQLLAEAEFVPESVRLIRDYSYQLDRLAGPGYFLVGDAAGFIDPIFSVGIVLALYSAHTAAWAIDRCLKDPANSRTSRAIYEKQVQARIELSRNLALPSYAPEEELGELVREAIKWEGPTSLNLISMVSRLTSRSENYRRVTGEKEDRALDTGMFVELEGLKF